MNALDFIKIIQELILFDANFIDFELSFFISGKNLDNLKVKNKNIKVIGIIFKDFKNYFFKKGKVSNRDKVLFFLFCLFR